MKRSLLWLVGAGIASVALVLALEAQEQKTGNPPTPSPAPAEGKAVFTFADEAQMQQFAQLWQQRQAILTRMAVLKSYWDQEQPTLAQLDQQLLTQYNLDVNKNYSLDPDRRVLLEQPTPPAVAPQASLDSTAAPGSAPLSSTP